MGGIYSVFSISYNFIQFCTNSSFVDDSQMLEKYTPYQYGDEEERLYGIIPALENEKPVRRDWELVH